MGFPALDTYAGRPLGDFGIGPYQKDENRPQNRTQIGPKIGLIFYKTLKIGPILKKQSRLEPILFMFKRTTNGSI